MLPAWLLGLCLALSLSACKLSTPACSITCEQQSGCPLGLTCGQDGYCHSDGKLTGCGATAVGDGGAHILIAFVSRDPWTPAGGRDAADQFCSDQANIPAAVSGLGARRFLALLATTLDPAGNRFKNFAGWNLVDGTEWIASGNDLWSGVPTAPLDLDQTGNNAGGVLVWTGASFPHSLGEPQYTCGDWAVTSQFADVGLASSKDRWFDQTTGYPCSSGVTRLYCLEIPSGD